MKLRYAVMGKRPGDGGVYEAHSEREALAIHLLQDTPEIPLDVAVRRLKKHGHGDYEVHVLNPVVAS